MKGGSPLDSTFSFSICSHSSSFNEGHLPPDPVTILQFFLITWCCLYLFRVLYWLRFFSPDLLFVCLCEENVFMNSSAFLQTHGGLTLNILQFFITWCCLYLFRVLYWLLFSPDLLFVCLCEENVSLNSSAFLHTRRGGKIESLLLRSVAATTTH